MPLPTLSEVLHWFGGYRPRYAFTVAVVAALLLFLPNSSTLAYFSLNKIAHDYRAIIALIFAGAVVLLATYSLEAGWKLCNRHVRRYRTRKWMEEQLYSLGEDETRVLSQYVQTGKTSLHFLMTNGAVHSLVAKGILYRPEQLTRLKYGQVEAAYNVTAEAAPFLRFDTFKKLMLEAKAKASDN